MKLTVLRHIYVVLKLCSINQAQSLQFSLQDCKSLEARSFLETSFGSRKKRSLLAAIWYVDLILYHLKTP